MVVIWWCFMCSREEAGEFLRFGWQECDCPDMSLYIMS